MNVLLAETDVLYKDLGETEDINPLLRQTDVAILIRASGVVDPLPRTDPNSPIAGMPTMEVDQIGAVAVTSSAV